MRISDFNKRGRKDTSNAERKTKNAAGGWSGSPSKGKAKQTVDRHDFGDGVRVVVEGPIARSAVADLHARQKHTRHTRQAGSDTTTIMQKNWPRQPTHLDGRRRFRETQDGRHGEQLAVLPRL